jgi:hypothetical protein
MEASINTAESFGHLSTFIKHGAYKFHPLDHYTPIHYLTDRAVLENETGRIEFKLQSCLPLALNLLMAARDSAPICDDLQTFVRECQSLVEDSNNKKSGRGIYAKHKGLPHQYSPKSELFRQFQDVIKFDRDLEPKLPWGEALVKHKLLLTKRLTCGDLAGYRRLRGCPPDPPSPSSDVCGVICNICEHGEEAHTSWLVANPGNVP